MGQKNKFFHLGKENDWKSLLDKKINNEIKIQELDILFKKISK